MSWLDTHKQSEELAAEAHAARRTGNLELARKLFATAALFEERALESIEADQKPRTFGISAVSAVALYYKGGELARAEQLAHRCLANPSLLAFGVDQLRELLQTIWNEQAQAAAGIKFAPAQVTVAVDGGEVVRGGAPLDLVVERVQTVQAMFYRTTEFLKSLPLRKRGPATKPILDVCRPWLFQSVPGSYQFTVAIQGDSQADMFQQQNVSPDLVASTFMSILQSAATAPEDALPEIVPDPDYQQAFLKLTRNLAPSGRTFTQLEVRSSATGEPVLLTSDSRKAITGSIRKRQESPDARRVETLQGVLRAVHLDKDWLDLLLADGKSLHVVGLGEALDDVIGPMVNHAVAVRVSVDAKGNYHFQDIELEERE
jgi:hypothetical protein